MVVGVSTTLRLPLPARKTRYPFYRRLGGPQGRPGRVENLVPTGIRSRTFQPVVSRYTDWATRPTDFILDYFTNVRNVNDNTIITITTTTKTNNNLLCFWCTKFTSFYVMFYKTGCLWLIALIMLHYRHCYPWFCPTFPPAVHWNVGSITAN